MRRIDTRVRVAGLLLAVVVASAACGGSSEKRLTKEQYIEQADAICKPYEVQIEDKIESELGELPEDPSDWSAADKEKLATTFRNDFLPLAEEELEKVKKLKPPKEDQKTIDAMLAAVEEANKKIAEVSQGSGEQLVDMLVNGEEPNAKANQLAQEYGLQECGSGD